MSFKRRITDEVLTSDPNLATRIRETHAALQQTIIEIQHKKILRQHRIILALCILSLAVSIVVLIRLA
jgi:hypothetical protein